MIELLSCLKNRSFLNRYDIAWRDIKSKAMTMTTLVAKNKSSLFNYYYECINVFCTQSWSDDYYSHWQLTSNTKVSTSIHTLTLTHKRSDKITKWARLLCYYLLLVLVCWWKRKKCCVLCSLLYGDWCVVLSRHIGGWSFIANYYRLIFFSIIGQWVWICSSWWRTKRRLRWSLWYFQ